MADSAKPSRRPLPRASTGHDMHFLHRTLIIATLGCGAAAVAQASDFTLSSPDLASGTFSSKFILNAFGCTGGNVSPELKWQNAPAGTKGFALQVLDLDAPTGSGFWHWAVYNIPAGASGLAQGAGNAAATLPAPAFGGNTDFVDTGATRGNGNHARPWPPTGGTPQRHRFTPYGYGGPGLQAPRGIPRARPAG